LTGNYYGTKTLQASELLTNGTFDRNHPVSCGFVNLYEGVTICYPKKVDDRIKVFAYNTDPLGLKAASFYIEPKGNEGFMWVDTGFTKLSPSKAQEVEVKRYVTNVSGYCVRR